MQLLVEAEDHPKATSVKTQLISLWSVPIFGAVILVAFLACPAFVLPMSPAMSADQVAQFYRENSAMLRFSMITFQLCGIMLLPLFMVVVVQIKRMSTPSTVLAYCYLTAAVSGATMLALSDMFFLVAAFRTERSPDLIQVLNDMGWMTFIAPVGTPVALNLVLALAIYLDNGPRRVFPRWVGHVSVIVAVLMAPAVWAAVTYSGPLAWNGVVSFWLRNATMVAYAIMMFFVLRAAVMRQAIEEGLTP